MKPLEAARFRLDGEMQPKQTRAVQTRTRTVQEITNREIDKMRMFHMEKLRELNEEAQKRIFLRVIAKSENAKQVLAQTVLHTERQKSND